MGQSRAIRALEGPSNPVGPAGPRVDSHGGQGFVSGIYYKETTTNNYTIEFVLYVCERTGLRGAKRSDLRSLATRQQKMAAKFGFSLIGKRDFLEDPKKYTFGKSIFKTFSKSRKTQILPPFLSTLDS